MAVRAKPRRAPRPRRAAQGRSWERSRAAVGLILFMAAFAALWLLNGKYTVDFATLTRGWPSEQGWAAHLIISAVEVLPAFVIPFLPKPIRMQARILLLVLALPFGVFDVLSSSTGVMHDLLADQYTPGMIVLAVLLGSLVAHAPERVMVYLLGLLWHVWKGQYA